MTKITTPTLIVIVYLVFKKKILILTAFWIKDTEFLGVKFTIVPLSKNKGVVSASCTPAITLQFEEFPVH